MFQIGQNSYPMKKISIISPLEDGTSDPRYITKKDLQVMPKELERWKQEFEEDEALNMRFHNPDFWKDLNEALKPLSDYKMILFRGFLSIISTLPKAKYFASDPYCRVNSDTVRRLEATLNSRTVAESTSGSSTAYPIGMQPSFGDGGGQLHNPQANRNKEHVISIPSGLAGTHPETGVASTMVDNSSSSGANPDDNRSPSEFWVASTPGDNSSSSGANPDDNRSPSDQNKEHVISIPSGLAGTHPETGAASTMVDNSSSSGANPDDNRSPSEANPDDNRSPPVDHEHEFDLEKKIIPVVTIISCLGVANKSNSEMSRNDKILVYCFLGCLLTLLVSGSYGILLARFKGPRINVIAHFLLRLAYAAAGAALIVVIGMWLPNDESKLLVTGLVCCAFLPALGLRMMK